MKRHLINRDQKAKRWVRSEVLLNVIKHKPPVIFITDEKLFWVDRVSNSRHDRYISSLKAEEVPDNIRYTFKTKHPAALMVFCLVASDGNKMPPVFIDQGLKITADIYINILKNHVKLWIEATYPANTKYIYQNDGAPAHTAKKTEEWMEKNFVAFWGKEMWPPSSPDLNPLDYSIWAKVEEDACSKPHSSVTSLKASVETAWSNLSKGYIKKTCHAFRGRLEAVVVKEGLHIE